MEKITVSIRVRPLNKQEASKGSPWKITSNSISLCNQTTGAQLPGQSYVFDSVFGTVTRTLDIYEAHTQAIIASAVRGFNGTVFAYGQTSSGKTFTMRGSSAEPGIIPLAIKDVFSNIQQAEDREFLLRVSYMEIYNEEINDLLAPENRKLQVHENIERGIFVAGLREEIVSTPEQVLQLMEFGEAHRHIGETNMNVYSSRSHTIFRMVIESRDRSQDDPTQPATLQACDAVRVSVLNLVDLAGSERVAKTGAEGARLKEGSHINKSLMTLGTVINKLSEGIENQGGHVPYRDSKLTRILQPALGGNARTVIICNVTPALMHVDETKGTLQFASRAIRVTNCAQVNEIVTDAALLKRQKREIEELRTKLQENHSEHLEEEILNLRNAMLKIELERERMALELQDKAARERRMKEQIENLSTLVLNSAVDDRHTDKSVKKTNRRETWCPRLPSSKPVVEVQSLKKPSLNAYPDSSVLGKRERTLPLPPPFEKLTEEEESPIRESAEVALQANSHDDGKLIEPTTRVYVADRRHKSSDRLRANEEELLDLQAQYQDLHCQHEVAILEIEKLRIENENLKSTATKKAAIKSVDGDRRCKSLDGSQADVYAAIISELQTQVQTLEMEKVYMQRELDSRMEHAKGQTNSAKQVLEELYEELKESNQQIELLTTRNMHLEKEKEEVDRSYIQLVRAFEDLKSELDKVHAHALDSMESFMNETREMKSFSQIGDQMEELKVLSRHNEAQFAELMKRFAILAKEKSLLENKMDDEEVHIRKLKTAVVEASKELERYENESYQLKVEISALQKDLSSAKVAPSGLEKEKEVMRKELEKNKAKLKDIEAKLKTALQDKSKLEAEKANMDRELRVLRGQSALLQRDIDKRESLADKRRESVATGLNKTKQQLTSVEHALQSKSVELEKTSFELQVLQDAYEKMEVSLAEAKDAVEVLEKRLALSEQEMLHLKNDKEKATTDAENNAIELEAATEQWRATSSQLDELQKQHENLVRQFQACDAARQASAALAEELATVKEELALELTDVYYKLEEEKAVSASRQSALEEKESRCCALNDKLKVLAEAVDKRTADVEAAEHILEVQLRELEQAAIEREAQTVAAYNQKVEQLENELNLLKESVCKAEAATEEGMKSRIGDAELVQELNQMLEANKVELSKAEAYKQQTKEIIVAKQGIEERMHKLEDALNASHETCALHNEKVQQLRMELKSAFYKCEELEQKVALAKSDEEDQRSQNELLKERISQVQNREKQLETILEAMRQDERYKSENQKLLVSNTKLQVAFDAMSARAEVFEVRLEDARWELIEFRDKATTAQEKMEASLAVAKLEIVELKVELENVKDALVELHTQKCKLEHEGSAMKSELASSQALPWGITQKDGTSIKRKPSDLQLHNNMKKKLKERDQEKHGSGMVLLSGPEAVVTPCTKLNKGIEQGRSPLSPIDNLQTPATDQRRAPNTLDSKQTPATNQRRAPNTLDSKQTHPRSLFSSKHTFTGLGIADHFRNFQNSEKKAAHNKENP